MGLDGGFFQLLGLQGRLSQMGRSVEGALRRLVGGMQAEARRLEEDPRLRLYFDSVTAGKHGVEARFGSQKLQRFLDEVPELSGFEVRQVSFESIHRADGEPAPEHLEDALRKRPELGPYLVGGMVEDGGKTLVLYFTEGAKTDARHLLQPVELAVQG